MAMFFNPELHVSDVTTVTNEECKKNYAGETDIVDSMLCALEHGRDACRVSVKGLDLENIKYIMAVLLTITT